MYYAYGRTNKRNGRMDKPSYRYAWTLLAHDVYCIICFSITLTSQCILRHESLWKSGTREFHTKRDRNILRSNQLFFSAIGPPTITLITRIRDESASFWSLPLRSLKEDMHAAAESIDIILVINIIGGRMSVRSVTPQNRQTIGESV